MTEPHIVIAGAGSIGCFVGGLLAASGRRVTLLGRARTLADIEAHGLTLTDFAGLDRHVPATRLNLSETPDCLARAGLVLVTVKSGDTGEIADLIARYTPTGTPVVSLQNGLSSIDILQTSLPGFDTRAGMVPFNVVPGSGGHYHRSTSGDILIAAGSTPLDALFNLTDLPLAETPDITAVQWGKLVINLNNAINALSGLTLQQQLVQRGWRRLMADQMSEALAVLRIERIRTKSTTPLPMWLIPHILRLPTPLFRRIAAPMLTIDPSARTSMSHDLIQNRETEIDSLQGSIISLANNSAFPTPLNSRMAMLIKQAEQHQQESPGLSVKAILDQ